MGIKRYELSEAQWARIAQLLPGKAGAPGRTGSGNLVRERNAVDRTGRGSVRLPGVPAKGGCQRARYLADDRPLRPLK
jgi:hypothetical protein